METMIISSLIFGGLCSAIANYKGRPVAQWFFWGFIGTFIAFICVCCKKNISGLVECPNCKELIRPDATVCRFCGRSVE
jgi:hypothetical protein